MKLNYKEDVKVNDQALDLELLDQAELAVKYGKEWVIARKKVALLEEKEKIIRSKLIRKAWKDPNSYLNQPKATAQTVEAFYRDHKKHKKIKQEKIEAQEELDLIEVAKNEIVFTKKFILENMVKLYLGDYFAGPNVPHDLSKLRNKDKDRQDAVDKQIKVKRKKIKK